MRVFSINKLVPAAISPTVVISKQIRNMYAAQLFCIKHNISDIH